jgi:GntR family transcriptional regulator, transcriptional repressor for pyruvate dehydrogenase complex
VTAIRRLAYQSLADQVKTSLLEYISERGLQPGDVLPPEGVLAAEFGVSRPVIREALKALEGMSVVQVAKGRGTVIRPLDNEQLVVFFDRALRIDSMTVGQLLEFREVIEAGAAMLAATRRTADELAEMRQTAAEMRASMRRRDAYVHLDSKFHLQITSACHNPLLLQFGESVREAVSGTIREGRRHLHGIEQADRIQAAHEELLHQIEQRSPEGARRAMVAHFEMAANVIEDSGSAPSQKSGRVPRGGGNVGAGSAEGR